MVDLGHVLGPEEVEAALDRGLDRPARSASWRVEHVLDQLARSGRSGCGVLRRVLDDRALGDQRPDGLLEPRMARLLRDAGLPPAALPARRPGRPTVGSSAESTSPTRSSASRSRWTGGRHTAPAGVPDRPRTPEPARHGRVDGAALHLARRRAPSGRTWPQAPTVLCTLRSTP